MMIFLLLFAFIISFALPMRAEAEEKEPKVVRVGWYESSFCYYDSFGDAAASITSIIRRSRRTPDGPMSTWRAAGRSFCRS